MHPTLADEIVKSVRKRISQGDCPTEPPQSIETLEGVIDELADRPRRQLRALGEAIMKFAPDLGNELATRWVAAIKERDERLEAFLQVLRQQAN